MFCVITPWLSGQRIEEKTENLKELYSVSSLLCVRCVRPSVCYTQSVMPFKSLTLTRQTFIMNHCHVYLHLVLWQLTLTHVGSICVILCPFVVSRQVGEIEEQLAAARREVTKSEEANQKLQREVKEVCRANLSLPGQDPELPRFPGLQVYIWPQWAYVEELLICVILGSNERENKRNSTVMRWILADWCYNWKSKINAEWIVPRLLQYYNLLIMQAIHTLPFSSPVRNLLPDLYISHKCVMRTVISCISWKSGTHFILVSWYIFASSRPFAKERTWRKGLQH